MPSIAIVLHHLIKFVVVLSVELAARCGIGGAAEFIDHWFSAGEPSQPSDSSVSPLGNVASLYSVMWLHYSAVTSTGDTLRPRLGLADVRIVGP